MGAAVSINRLDLTASELRKAASGEKDSAAARRILALALVLDGLDRKTAAETCGMDRQTLRDWVHRYNAAGLTGLRNLKSPGAGSKLTARQQAELAELVERRARARVGEATSASNRWWRHGRLVGSDLVSAGPCCLRARRDDRRCLLL